MRPAIWVGVAVVLAGGLAGLLIPRRPQQVTADPSAKTQPQPETRASTLQEV
jgi:hypothetical protein